MPSAVEAWNRKLHIYVSLYFLFFLWLFCLSGVLLNHPGWHIAQFWPVREQSSRELQIVPPGDNDDPSLARGLMDQMHIRGEVSGGINRSPSGELDFRVVRPGDIYEVHADLVKGQAKLSHTHVNRWGVLFMLHSFSGVRRTDLTLRPNWWLTLLWRFSMDALAAGLSLLVLSGIYIWYSRAQHRRGGMVALVLGILTAAVFVAGPWIR